MRECFIFNPNAGAAGQADALRDRLRNRPGATVCVPSDREEAVRLAVRAVRDGFERIVSVGGDGTAHTLVNALAADLQRIRFGILPLGTGNDLCRTLGIPLDPPEALDTLDSGVERTIDLIRVELPDRSMLCINVAAGGFSGQTAAEVTAEQKKFWGPLAYLRGVAGVLPALTGYQVAYRFDDGPEERSEVLNFVVANGRTAAGGLLVAPPAEPDDGLLNAVLVSFGPVLDLSLVAARLMASDYLADAHVTHRTARRVAIESEPAMPFSIDGELVEAHHIAFSILPHALRVMTGKPPSG